MEILLLYKKNEIKILIQQLHSCLFSGASDLSKLLYVVSLTSSFLCIPIFFFFFNSRIKSINKLSTPSPVFAETSVKKHYYFHQILSIYQN